MYAGEEVMKNDDGKDSDAAETGAFWQSSEVYSAHLSHIAVQYIVYYCGWNFRVGLCGNQCAGRHQYCLSHCQYPDGNRPGFCHRRRRFCGHFSGSWAEGKGRAAIFRLPGDDIAGQRIGGRGGGPVFASAADFF